MLDGPAALHKFIGEPVEQFGMRRAAAVCAEVAGRIHDAVAECVVPQPVHEHARGQRVLRAGDPVREPHATLLVGLVHREAERAGDRERIGRDDLALLHRLPTVKAICSLRRGGKVSHPRVLGKLVDSRFQRGEIRLQLPRSGGLGCRDLCEKVARITLGVEWLTVLRAGDRCPFSRLRSDLDPILRGNTVREAHVAIAAPHDALDAGLCRETDLHPALAPRVGNPTVLVSSFAVVDVLQLVNRVSRQRARGARDRASLS